MGVAFESPSEAGESSSKAGEIRVIRVQKWSAQPSEMMERLTERASFLRKHSPLRST